jgi:hypothetical protein
VFNTLVRSLTLLDASGNSAFPGTVSAPSGFVGNLTGKATSAGTADTAIKAQQDRNGKVIDETYATILVGEVKMYAGRTAPDGYLWCDGRAVSRTTYAKLFAAIGTIWGNGDGATTFNLPDFRKRFPEGANSGSEVGQTVQAGLPNIAGGHLRLFDPGAIETVSGGPWTVSTYPAIPSYAQGSSQSGWDMDIDFDASRANQIYGRSSTVQPSSAKCLYIIKY